ncbi:MAG: iron-sulfur cluster repair di-iron protein [Bacteroidota bacterium]|jgi:regulator of cell morphogenesis and NO signaling|nr:MAG: iron-sulfur cluster repair di-iron protein [Bacteroidota bacterium]
MDSEKTGAVAARDVRAAQILRSNGLDYCCEGNKSLEEACADANVPVEKVRAELEALPPRRTDEALQDFSAIKPDALTRYIEDVHHRYTEEAVEYIGNDLIRLVSVHGNEHPELLEIQKVFGDMRGSLVVHMKKEEFMLFPYIRKMVTAGKQAGAPIFGTVASPIAVMMHEHDEDAERLRQLSTMTRGYTLPDDACRTFRTTYAAMKELDEDLRVHIHLENNILFPAALELEKEIREERVD